MIYNNKKIKMKIKMKIFNKLKIRLVIKKKIINNKIDINNIDNLQMLQNNKIIIIFNIIIKEVVYIYKTINKIF